ncbi:PAS domain [Pseudocohnilembus persalinus]|uniref:PAS domain n=1 Tax=Pseudocohnilembus persalinus TaxID=266149 RepID=A0A0V0QWH6_PSEPJ|nr:PAS domain [Pseudocohnilembus persalinus]|eukprot:KRX06429.1 PAS domain [Pseudocohnilembus persalinus]
MNNIDTQNSETFQLLDKKQVPHLQQISNEKKKQEDNKKLDFKTKISLIQQEYPELCKIRYLGQKVFKQRKIIEKKWENISLMSENKLRLLSIYSIYVKDVLNDDEKAKNIIYHIQELKQIQDNNGSISIILNLEDIVEQQDATIVISAEQQTFSQIIGINQSACSLFGYQNFQLLNKDIKVLMPNAIKQVYDKILQNISQKYNNNNHTHIQERQVYALHQNQYIIPLYIQVLPMQTLKQEQQYIAKIRQAKKFRQGCYILTDLQGNIQNLSSHFQYLQVKSILDEPLGYTFKFEKSLKNEFVSLSNQFSAASTIVQSQQVSQKQNKDQIYTFEFDYRNKSIKGSYNQIFKNQMPHNKPIQSLVMIEEEISFNSSQQFNQNGNHQIKENNDDNFEKYQDNIQDPLHSNMNEFQQPNQIDSQNFKSLQESQQKKQKIIDQIDKISYSNQINQGPTQMEMDDSNPNIKYYDNGQQRYDYQIRTVRLNDGIFQDISNDKQMYESEMENQNQNFTTKSNNQQNDSLDNSSNYKLQSINQLKRALDSIIQSSKLPLNLEYIFKAGLFLFVYILILVVLEFIISENQYKESVDYMGLIIMSSARVGHSQRILGCIQDLQIIQRGLYDSILVTETAKGYIINGLLKKGQAENVIRGIKNPSLLLQLFQYKKQNRQDFQIRVIYKFLPNFYLKVSYDGSPEESIEYDTIDNCIQQFLKYTQNLLTLNYSEISFDNSSVYFLVKNMFSDFQTNLYGIINEYVHMQNEKLTYNDEYYKLIFGISQFNWIDNIQRQMLFYPFQYEYYDKNGYDIIDDKLKTILQLDQQLHIQYADIQNQLHDFSLAFQEIMYGDSCVKIVEYGGFLGDYDTCAISGQGFAGVNPQEGMRLVSSHYMQNVKKVNYELNLMLQSKDEWSDLQMTIYGLTTVTSIPEISNRILLKKSFYQSFKYLIEVLEKDSNKMISFIQKERVIFFTIWLILIILMVFLLWIPYFQVLKSSQSE